MSQIDTNISVYEESKVITLSGLAEDKVVIDYSGDVDFTGLVSELTRCIDRDEEVNFSIAKDYDDEKLIVILDTIEEIFNKYNETISEELEAYLDEQTIDANSSDDDLPF